MSQELPKKWKMMSIGEIAKVYNGNSINKAVKQTKYTGLSEGRNFIATKDVAFDGTVTYENGVKIPFEETQFKTAPAGSVFVCSEGGSAGRKTAYITQEVCFGNKLYAIVKNHELYFGKFIYYFTRSQLFFKQFQRLLNGIIGGVNNKNFATIQLPVPSIEEQQRIVTRIEELFSELDSAVETLQKTRQQLEVYRQAVLKEAFDSIGEFVPFGTIIESRLGKMLDKEKNTGNPELYLRNINVRWFSFDLSVLLEMRIEPVEYEKYSLKCGDLVVCEGGEPGRCAVWDKESTIYYQKALHRIRFTDGSNPNFYMYYLWLAAKSGRLTPYYTGTGIKHLTGQSLVKIPVPICSRTIQDKLVLKIEYNFSVCDGIEKTINEALQQAEAMRQSILKKAFEGRL